MLLKVMCSTAQPVFWLFVFSTWTSSWPFPAPSLIDIGQVQQLPPAPCSAQAVTRCHWIELWPGAAKSRNDLLTFVFVFSCVRLPLRRKPKEQSPLLPACSSAPNGTGLTRLPPQLSPLLSAGGLRHAWHAGPGWGHALVQPQVEAMTWADFFKEQLQAGAGVGSRLHQDAEFQGLALLRCEQEVLQSFSPLIWW